MKIIVVNYVRDERLFNVFVSMTYTHDKREVFTLLHERNHLVTVHLVIVYQGRNVTIYKCAVGFSIHFSMIE